MELTWIQIITLLGILMITSKGRDRCNRLRIYYISGNFGAFPMIPVEGIALLIGVDRFMSEARAVTNLIGNGVACVVVSKSEKSLTQLWKNVHFRERPLYLPNKNGRNDSHLCFTILIIIRVKAMSLWIDADNKQLAYTITQNKMFTL